MIFRFAPPCICYVLALLPYKLLELELKLKIKLKENLSLEEYLNTVNFRLILKHFAIQHEYNSLDKSSNIFDIKKKKYLKESIIKIEDRLERNTRIRKRCKFILIKQAEDEV